MPEASPALGATELTEGGMDALLQALHPDREQAGRAYRSLHARLAFYFAHRLSRGSEALADEVLNRLARHLQAGETIAAVEAYAYGVARRLLLEEARRERRAAHAHQAFAGNIQVAQATPDEEIMLTAMTACLERRPAADRELLLAYYAGHGRAAIARRQQLAAGLNLAPGALRKRVFRLRAILERCVRARLARPESR